MEPIKVNHTSRCDGCGSPAGMRVRLGNESGPVRICFCGYCDIAPRAAFELLPPGARAAVEHLRSRA